MTVSEKKVYIRSPKRPNVDEFIRRIFHDFIELCGDRATGDDYAMCGGIATLGGRPVTVLGHRQGKNTAENIRCNFGMAQPSGYRKAVRLAKQAEKFGRPVICFVDTAGAFPGAEAETRGQGEAIAKSIIEFMDLSVPVLSIVTGEGGSGGALAIAIANEVFMLENALYSVISARGFASILWKDPARENEAAQLLKMTAEDLYRFGVVEGVIPEGKSNKEMSENIKGVLLSALLRYDALSPEEIRLGRQKKFRAIGNLL